MNEYETGLDYKPVAQSSDSLNVYRLGGVVFNFLPQTVDVNHNGIFVDDRFTPNHFVDHIFRENAVDVVDKQLHHGIFFGGEDDFFTVFVQPQGVGIITEGTGRNDAVLWKDTRGPLYDKLADMG